MKLGKILNDDIKKKLNEVAMSNCEIDQEEIEDRKFKEMEQLMGVHRDRYERRGGKVRRK